MKDDGFDPEVDPAADELAAVVSAEVRRDSPVSELTSFRVGGPAAILVEPSSAEELSKATRALHERGIATLVIGRGTNLLISDEGFRGAVLKLGKGFDWIKTDGDALEAGAAAALPQVANRAFKQGLTGLEFAIAIPAAVGGAVRMNAGAHGSSVSDVLESAVICDMHTGDLNVRRRSEIEMTYRATSLARHEVVCSARFRLRRGEGASIKGMMDTYRSHRSRTQPSEAPNAGSMFRNPAEDSAGRLIEEAGLKGFRIGAAEVSRKHANFFLAHRGATAQQIYDVMAHVQKTVEKRFGILLIPEVRVAGNFDTTSGLRFEER